MKNTLKWKKNLKNFYWNFSPWNLFGNIIRNIKFSFSFLCHYLILKHNNFLPNCQRFLCRVCKTFFTWFSVVSVLKKCERKRTFYFTEILSSHEFKCGEACQDVRHFCLILHTQFWKYFQSILLCSIDRNYFKKYGASFFSKRIFESRYSSHKAVWRIHNLILIAYKKICICSKLMLLLFNG